MKDYYQFRPFYEEDGGGAGGGEGGQGDAGGQGGGTGTLLGAAGAAEGQGTGEGTGTAGEQGGSGTVQPFYRDFYDATGKIDKTKLDFLPEQLKPFRSTYEKYDTVEALMLGTGHLASLAGKKGLQPLPDGADEKTVTEFNARVKEILKIPADPDGYGLTRPENVPEDLWSDDYAKEAAKAFHELNIPPAAAKKLVEMDAARAVQLHEQALQERADYVKGQQQKISETFGADSERKLALAKQTALKIGLNPNDPTFGDSAEIIIALSKVATMLGEGRITDAGATGPNGMTPGQRARDIAMNKANPKYEAYHKTNHPSHQAVLDEVQELMKAATG